MDFSKILEKRIYFYRTFQKTRKNGCIFTEHFKKIRKIDAFLSHILKNRICVCIVTTYFENFRKFKISKKIDRLKKVLLFFSEEHRHICTIVGQMHDIVVDRAQEREDDVENLHLGA